MGLPEIFLIAVGLAMDAFAVSITLGLSVKKPSTKELLLPGVYFGFFQALMPLIGYFAGILFARKIETFDHWIAFALLALIGGKMIVDSFSGNKGEEEKAAEDNQNKNSLRFAKMLVLAIATSIDALAVGITFAIFKIGSRQHLTQMRKHLLWCFESKCFSWPLIQKTRDPAYIPLT
jgi:putative Mn2+ efflux pump MntP